MMKNRKESGQIALMLVLIMTVIGTAAISLAGRTVVETRVQEVNVDSSQAMVAAEAGLEQALKVAPTGPLSGSLDANTTFEVTDSTTGTTNAIVGPFKNGETWEINLVGATAGSVNLYWESSPTGGSARGLYVSVVRSTGIVDYAIGPNTFGSGFNPAGIDVNQSLGGVVFDYRRAVTFTPGTDTAMKVMLLGGDSMLGFQAVGGNLGAQVRQKTATGTVTRGTETIKQGLGYYESVNDQVPSVFNFAVYSGGAITQTAY